MRIEAAGVHPQTVADLAGATGGWEGAHGARTM